MHVTINTTRLELAQGDITQQKTDAIVNAAAPDWAESGAVSDAICRAGGPQIVEEYRGLGDIAPGRAAITGGGKLPARHVIHAVVPPYSGGTSGEAEVLAEAYRSSLRLAAERGLKSIAFPSIGTGVLKYPLEEAVPVALRTVVEFLRSEAHDLELVRFVLLYINGRTYSLYGQALRDLTLRSAASEE